MVLFTRCHLLVRAPTGQGHVCRTALLSQGLAAHRIRPWVGQARAPCSPVQPCTCGCTQPSVLRRGAQPAAGGRAGSWWQTQPAQSVWGCRRLRPKQALEKTFPLPSGRDLWLSSAREQGKPVLALAAPAVLGQPQLPRVACSEAGQQPGPAAGESGCTGKPRSPQLPGQGSCTHPCFSEQLRAQLLLRKLESDAGGRWKEIPTEQ